MINIKSIQNKIGNWYQVAGTRHYSLLSGNNNGTRAIDVRTGGGLEYTVLLDRGLDISLASFKGHNLVYQGSCGEVNPAFYNTTKSEWLWSFYGGLLTTCGPANIGPPCVDNGESLGLHGRFNNTPARSVCDLTRLTDEENEICIKGEIESSVIFGSKIRTVRTIKSPYGENRILIKDVIKNETGKSIPFAMLYHINLGYPMLDEGVKISVNSNSVEASDEESAKDINNIKDFSAPDSENKEKNYLHKFDKKLNTGKAEVLNEKLGLKLVIKFDLATLGYLSQWKMEGIKDYVLGLEPCNAPCQERSALRAMKLLPSLGENESVIHRVEIGIESYSF